MDSLNEAVATAEEEEEDEAKIEAFEDAIDDIKMLDEEVNALYGITAPVDDEEEEDEEEEETQDEEETEE